MASAAAADLCIWENRQETVPPPSPRSSCPFMTRTCERELIWKQDLYRYNHIQRKSCLMMTKFNPMTGGDHIREKWRHTGKMSCYGWSRDWSNSASRQGRIRVKVIWWEKDLTSYCCLWRGKQATSQGMQQPLEVGKDKKTDPPLDS